MKVENYTQGGHVEFELGLDLHWLCSTMFQSILTSHLSFFSSVNMFWNFLHEDNNLAVIHDDYHRNTTKTAIMSEWYSYQRFDVMDVIWEPSTAFSVDNDAASREELRFVAWFHIIYTYDSRPTTCGKCHRSSHFIQNALRFSSPSYKKPARGIVHQEQVMAGVWCQVGSGAPKIETEHHDAIGVIFHHFGWIIYVPYSWGCKYLGGECM